MKKQDLSGRRSYLGGSDARIIMGQDEAALVRLWREKRGEAEPQDHSDNLIVQLGAVTEDLNRRWYEANTGQVITDIQRRMSGIQSCVGWEPPSMAASRGSESRVRSQVHAAVVVLGGSGR